MKQLLVILLACCTVSMSAQVRKKPVAKPKTAVQAKKPAATSSVVQVVYDLKYPCHALVIDKEKYTLDPKANTGRLKLWKFPAGYYTAVITLEGEDFTKQFGHQHSLSWSGSTIFADKTNGGDGWTIYKVNRYPERGGFSSVTTLCGMFQCSESRNTCGVVYFSDSKAFGVSDLYEGQTIESVREKCAQIKGVKFEELGKESGMTVYVAKWFEMTDDYRDIYGTMHSSFSNDKEYFRFFFDAQGKLKYWYQTL